MIHTLFDKVYLINLDKRTDRLAAVDARCKSIGLEYTRFPAIDGDLIEDPGIDFEADVIKITPWNINSYALVLTTIEIINDAKQNNYKSILIMEDDVEFHGCFNEHVKNGFETLPDDWEMYFMGTINTAGQHIHSRYLDVVKGGLYCHCYAINSNVYDTYLDSLNQKNKPVDVCTLLDVQPNGKSYRIVPNMAFQLKDYSDIMKNMVDHSSLRTS